MKHAFISSKQPNNTHTQTKSWSSEQFRVPLAVLTLVHEYELGACNCRAADGSFRKLVRCYNIKKLLHIMYGTEFKSTKS